MTAPGSDPRSRYVEVNGQRLHYKVWSDSGVPLILLHGVTSSSAGWDFIAPQLTDGYQVLAFDFRGHGLSSKPDSGYTWAGHYAADIAEFVERHLDQPAVLIGHSLGGAVTVPVAASAPDRVRAIILEDPPLFPRQANRSQFVTTLELKRTPYEPRVKGLMETMSLNQAAATRRAQELEAMHESVLVELIEGKTRYDPEEWLPKVACPSLVILGEPSRGGVMERQHRQRLPGLLKGVEVLEWDDVGHLIHFQKMERFVEEVRRFLRGLGLP